MASQPQPDPVPDSDVEALAWLARLQEAAALADFAAASRAERELEARGYVVRIVRPIPPNRASHEEVADARTM